MTIRKVSYLQGTVPAPYKLPAEDHRLNHAGLWTPDSVGGGLRVRSGIVPGPGSPGAVAVVAGGVNTNPFQAIIQGSITSTQGVYEVVSDAVEFRAITAASGTEYRRGYVIARIYDQLNPGTGTVQDLPAIEVVYGPNAASAGAATLPTLPANSLVLREFAVSNTGVITLTSTLPPWTVARGGVQPVDATDAVAGAYPGQYRDHPTLGPQRWTGSVWAAVGPLHGRVSGGGGTIANNTSSTVVFGALPASVVAGMVVRGTVSFTVQPAALTTASQTVTLAAMTCTNGTVLYSEAYQWRMGSVPSDYRVERLAAEVLVQATGPGAVVSLPLTVGNAGVGMTINAPQLLFTSGLSA